MAATDSIGAAGVLPVINRVDGYWAVLMREAPGGAADSVVSMLYSGLLGKISALYKSDGTPVTLSSPDCPAVDCTAKLGGGGGGGGGGADQGEGDQGEGADVAASSSSTYVAGGACASYLAQCSAAGFCFGHDSGCDADTGVLKSDGAFQLCAPASACAPCFPFSVCGALEESGGGSSSSNTDSSAARAQGFCSWSGCGVSETYATRLDSSMIELGGCHTSQSSCEGVCAMTSQATWCGASDGASSQAAVGVEVEMKRALLETGMTATQVNDLMGYLSEIMANPTDEIQTMLDAALSASGGEAAALAAAVGTLLASPTFQTAVAESGVDADTLAAFAAATTTTTTNDSGAASMASGVLAVLVATGGALL